MHKFLQSSRYCDRSSVSDIAQQCTLICLSLHRDCGTDMFRSGLGRTNIVFSRLLLGYNETYYGL